MPKVGAAPGMLMPALSSPAALASTLSQTRWQPCQLFDVCFSNNIKNNINSRTWMAFLRPIISFIVIIIPNKQEILEVSYYWFVTY